ncbi:hypothetical protein DRO03_02710 [Methanosarcinales archaeon]|nr:MAG: hypothetical protein DRO03_02710 [Methanosarcinales archaeon]
MEWFRKSGIVIVMTVSILRYFDKLEGTCRLCKYVWAGKNEPSVPDQYNQMSVRTGGFQVPFATLPEGQQENYLKRPILESV